MIIACIDGGLICGPVAIIIYLCSILGVGAWIKRRKWCKKKCACDCHDKPKSDTDQIIQDSRKVTKEINTTMTHLLKGMRK